MTWLSFLLFGGVLVIMALAPGYEFKPLRYSLGLDEWLP